MRKSRMQRSWNVFRSQPWIVQFGAWLALVCVLALLTPGLAHADLVVRSQDGATELRLLESACSHAGTLGYIRPEHQAEFKNARVLDRKGTIEAYGCWIEKDGAVLVVFEDASVAEVKRSALSDPML